MKIALVCNDTRGGIQPYVALALGLHQAGHEVRAVAPWDFVSMFADVGLRVASLSGSVEAAVRESKGATERGAMASLRYQARRSMERIHAWTKETLDACEGVDLLTGGVGGMVVGLSVAEKLGKPFIEAHLQPLGVPTADYPGVLLPGVPRWLGGWGRRMSHRLSEMALWMPFRGAMASARKKVLGLSGRSRATDGQPVLYGFSPRVVQVPATGGRERHVTGYWWLAAGPSWRPPPALDAFLSRGGPMVSIGFGSMASDDPAALTALVLGAVRKARVRAVFVAGWGGLESLPEADDVFCTDTVPYDWLFPRVALTVHHGGAGTTGLGLRAGIPAIVVPFTMDQPFWGSRVAALGAGPKPIPRARLTEQRLADALERTLGDETMRERAAALGEQIRTEEGVGEAVARYESMAVGIAAG